MKNIFLSLFMFISICSVSQTHTEKTYSIKGVVTDSFENTPVEAAIAGLYTGNKLIKGEATNKSGVLLSIMFRLHNTTCK